MAARRKRRTKAEIARILQLYHDTNLSQREFARRHRISMGTLNNWLRREAASGNDRAGKNQTRAGSLPQLLPVSVPMVSFQAADFELVLTDGRQLRIPAGFEPQVLVSLLKVLAAC